jgi:hypothetical protein
MVCVCVCIYTDVSEKHATCYLQVRTVLRPEDGAKNSSKSSVNRIYITAQKTVIIIISIMYLTLKKLRV